MRVAQTIAAVVFGLAIAHTASATIIIGGAVGNGDFEDFSGAWLDATAVPGDAGINGTSPDYTRVWMRGAGNVGKTYGIDGWTVTYVEGYTSFDRRTDSFQVGAGSATENRSYNLNQWSRARNLTSDTYSQVINPGDELTLSFDYIAPGGPYRLNAAVVFDQGLGTEWTRYIIGSDTTTVDFQSATGTQFERSTDFSYTLDGAESATTVTLVLSGYREDIDGTDYGMIKRGSGTGMLDNVVLQVIPEPSTLALLGLGIGAMLLRRRR